MKIGVYISNLYHIGGVETFTVNLCNRMSYDCIFNNAKLSSLNKLKNIAIQKDNVSEEYDVLIIATAWGTPPDNIKAKYYIQVIHADYQAYIKEWHFEYTKLPYTTHHVAVGKHVGSQFEKVTGYKCDKVIYNLLDNNKCGKKYKIPQEPLRLITLTRFSKEKGIERMIEFANKIRMPFVWDVYGDYTTPYGKAMTTKMGKFRLMGVTQTPKEIIGNYHYLVQLSDTEGFPYSVYESLQCLTPVISSNYLSVNELIEDGKNGYILNMDLSNFDENKIKNIPIIKSFKEKSSEKDWENFIKEIYN